VFRLPGSIRAASADYRAGIGIDLEHDRADQDRRIAVPVRVVWGGLGRLGTAWDVLAVWQEKANQVDGRAIPDSGHFISEEAPEALAHEIRGFFRAL